MRNYQEIAYFSLAGNALCINQEAKNKKSQPLKLKQLGLLSVRLIGLEPTRRKTLDPKSSASTNFATGAITTNKQNFNFAFAKVIIYFNFAKLLHKYFLKSVKVFTKSGPKHAQNRIKPSPLSLFFLKFYNFAL